MSFELLASTLREKLTGDPIGHKNEAIQALVRDHVVSREKVIEAAAGLMLPLYSHYTKTKNLESDKVVDFLLDEVLWEHDAISQLSRMTSRWSLDHGMTEEVQGQYRYLLVFNRGGSGISALYQDKDTGQVHSATLPQTQKLNFAMGKLTADQNALVQDALGKAEELDWNQKYKNHIHLSGYSANYQFKEDMRYADSGYRDLLNRVVRFTGNLDDDHALRPFHLSKQDIHAFNGRSQSMMHASNNKTFAYGHKVFRHEYLDQDALKLLNQVHSHDTVKLYQYLTDPTASKTALANRADFFEQYRLLSRDVSKALFKDNDSPDYAGNYSDYDRTAEPVTHEGKTLSKGEASRQDLIRLIDMDGANMDIKAIFPLLGIRYDPKGQHINERTLAHHLKGVTPQRAAGYLDIEGFMKMLKLSSKELLPKKRADWKGLQKLSPVLNPHRGPFDDDSTPQEMHDKKTKRLWKSIGKSGGIGLYIKGLEDLGLPRSNERDGLSSYLNDSANIFHYISANTGDLFKERTQKEFKQLRSDLDFRKCVKTATQIHESMAISNDVYALLSIDDRDAVTWSAVMEDPIDIANYTVTPLLNQAELSREGQEMRHCVGGYVSQCVRGQSTVVSIVNNTDPKDRATMEIRYDEKRDEKGKLERVMLTNAQCRSFSNQQPSKALELIAKQYISKVNRSSKGVLNNYTLMQDNAISDYDSSIAISDGRKVLGSILYIVHATRMGKPVNGETLDHICSSAEITQEAVLALMSEQGVSPQFKHLSLSMNDNMDELETIAPAIQVPF